MNTRRNTFYQKHKDELTILFLASANIPVIYQWYTGYESKILLLIFGISACVGLDFAVVTQTSKVNKNVFTWAALVLASIFTASIAITMYGSLPIDNGYLHAAYSIVLLFTSLSNSLDVVEQHSITQLDQSILDQSIPLPQLTTKEQQVYDYLIERSPEGISTRQLAEAMEMPYNSLRVYVKRLRDKEYVRNDDGFVSVIHRDISTHISDTP
jgi:DNA-binding CsgD family transcriptional regulator